MLTEEHRVVLFENRVLRSIFGPNNKTEVTGGWKILSYIMRSSTVCIFHQI
jgi:hypothetical protein